MKTKKIKETIKKTVAGMKKPAPVTTGQNTIAYVAKVRGKEVYFLDTVPLIPGLPIGKSIKLTNDINLAFRGDRLEGFRMLVKNLQESTDETWVIVKIETVTNFVGFVK